MYRLQSLILIFVGLIGHLLIVQAQGDEGSLQSILVPVDEADQNPDFKTFRDSLLVAIEKKDVVFLLGHIDSKIRVSFGMDYGFDDFVKYWKLNENPDRSRLWLELKEVLRLGGFFRNAEKTSFTAPYLFTKFPKDFDAFFYAAVTDSNVYLRSEPDSISTVLDTLNYSIVKGTSDPWHKSNYWWKIETLSGLEGYVESRSVRRSIDYRANFKQKDGKWMMTFFLAGD